MRYRYRNVVLFGEWRDNREDAIEDAIKAGQVAKAEDGSLIWVDHGVLEEDTGEASEIVRPKF